MHTAGKKTITGLETLQFAMESSITPMSGVGAEIYTLPTAYKGNFIDHSAYAHAPPFIVCAYWCRAA